MPNQPAIILFDGVCNFCNSSVNFVIKRDKKAYFKFAPLQSELAEKLLGKPISEMPDSVVLIENNKVHYKSTAALMIAKKLDGLWPIFYLLIIIPRPIRDWVYNLIAKNRYKIFGKKDSCMIPDPAIKARFLGMN
jgi:predicted DCC family thiol-disulfide oxidoreductase YuxK